MGFAGIKANEPRSMNCCVLRPRYRPPATTPNVPSDSGLAQVSEQLRGGYFVLRALVFWPSILMFLSFPTLGRTHNFTNHLRTPLVRRFVIEHTSFNRVEARSNEQIVTNRAWPQLFLVAEPATNALPKSSVELTTPPIGRRRLLLRLKLRRSSSNSQDPLI
jgi:hypothetical protein